MSYEPTLVIYYHDLQARAEEIESDIVDDAHVKLAEALKYPPNELHGVKFVIFNVELTSRNARVRDLLDELEIDYTTDW